LSHLGGLNAVEALDLNSYAENKKAPFRLPAKGTYTLRAPESFPTEAITRTKAGALQFQIDPTVVGPADEGYTVRFSKISAKTFERSGQQVSQVGDYLRACGFRGLLTDEQAIADAVETTAGATYEAKLDWSAYNKRTGWRLDGMEKFPKNEDGTYQPWVIDPLEVGKTDDQGRQLRVFANVVIPFGGFIPQAD
jgi:hypothetical protein